MDKKASAFLLAMEKARNKNKKPIQTQTQTPTPIIQTQREIKPCRRCDEPIYIMTRPTKKEEAGQIKIEMVKTPFNKSDNLVHKCKFSECKKCGGIIHFDPKITRPVKESEKDRIDKPSVCVPLDKGGNKKHICYFKCKKCDEYVYFRPEDKRILKQSEKNRLGKETLNIPLNKRNSKKHRCPNGPLPTSQICKGCHHDIYFDRLYYDDIKGQFIPLNTGTTEAHTCKNTVGKKMVESNAG